MSILRLTVADVIKRSCSPDVGPMQAFGSRPSFGLLDQLFQYKTPYNVTTRWFTQVSTSLLRTEWSGLRLERFGVLWGPSGGRYRNLPSAETYLIVVVNVRVNVEAEIKARHLTTYLCLSLNELLIWS